MSNKLEISLPWPPSLNRCYRSFKGRVLLSREGRDYIQLIKSIILTSSIKTFKKERLTLFILAFPPDRRRRDLDNLLKIFLDSLQKSGLYEDDEQIDFLSIERCSIIKDGLLKIQIFMR